MRVLHVLPSISAKLGGPTEVAINLVKELEAQGVQAEIATTDDDAAGRLDVPLHCLSRYRNAAVWFFPKEEISRKQFIPSRSLAAFFSRSIHLYDLIDIHYLYTFSSTISSYLAHKRGVPYTIRTMGQLSDWSRKQRRSLKWLYSKTLDRKLIKNSALIHCTTEGEQEDVRSCGINNPIKVLPLGVHKTEIIEDAPARLRKNFNIPANSQVILFLSRLHEKKRPELLIDLLKDLKSPLPLHLIIAGQGGREYLELLKTHVERNNVSNRVHFAGFVGAAQRSELLQGADLFVLPSHSDNFSLAVAEALEAGASVITTKEVQISPDIIEADCGIIIENCETELKSAIEDLLFNQERRLLLGQRARELAHRKYSWSSITQQLINVYQDIITTSKTRREQSANSLHML